MQYAHHNVSLTTSPKHQPYGVQILKYEFKPLTIVNWYYFSIKSV